MTVQMRELRPSWLPRFAWLVLLYNLPVIGWGAFVRLSFSGDGCGNHWPDCGGQLIPAFTSQKVLIEYSHRLMSGLDGILVAILVFFVVRGYGWRSGTSITALLVGVFTVVEALLGRWLVKAHLVGYDGSVLRASSLSIHLANTFVLLGLMTVLAVRLKFGVRPVMKGQGAVVGSLLIGMLCLLVVGMSGTVTSLGDSLYPVKNTHEAIQQALDPTRSFLIQLRVLHPMIALAVGAFIVLLGGLLTHLRPDARVKRTAKYLVLGYGLQIGVGALAIVLKAPDWMAVMHLLAADLLWIGLTALACFSLAAQVKHVEEEEHGKAAPAPARLRDYVALTKPRVISLLLFTTVAALIAAAGGFPGWPLLLAVLVGGYCSAGAANAINMVIDRDIDEDMARTAKRPTVTRSISAANALIFAFCLELVSFGVLWAAANLLSAALALCGLAFYVVIYTLLLKRRTLHNIVIGGAAGAVPPLVGWAAFTGNLNPLAWVLFAIIFVWTPVHFWALAIMIKEDYANARVPMMPVVKGDRATAVQIVAYGVITVVVSMLPAFLPGAGFQMTGAYFIGAAVLNAVLMWLCVRLLQEQSRKRALHLFKYSMLYLALLFTLLAADSTHGTRPGQVQANQGSLRLGALNTERVAHSEAIRNIEREF